MNTQWLHKNAAADRERAATRRGPLKVLVVDDSATVRQVLTAVLPEKRGFRVAVAADPIVAMEKMKKSLPDVILLDLEMPKMDGMTFLRKLMAENPLPVVVCSSMTGPNTEGAIRALENGAVDIITKPKIGVRGFLEESAVLLEDTVRAAAHAKLRARRRSSRTEILPSNPKLNADAVLPRAKMSAPSLATGKIVAIGASTGGTEALLEVLGEMPSDVPGIVVVQHMPEVFTRAFADRLNRSCRINVKEAADGDPIVPGQALIAQGNRHMIVRRRGGHYAVEVAGGELVNRHRPSVDVLFRSVAQTAGRNAVGIIMTGMGDDGAAGLLEMKQAGAFTIAQDEASSVVFGMPKEAIERGAADEVLPLSQIPIVLQTKLRSEKA